MLFDLSLTAKLIIHSSGKFILKYSELKYRAFKYSVSDIIVERAVTRLLRKPTTFLLREICKTVTSRAAKPRYPITSLSSIKGANLSILDNVFPSR